MTTRSDLATLLGRREREKKKKGEEIVATTEADVEHHLPSKLLNARLAERGGLCHLLISTAHESGAEGCDHSVFSVLQLSSCRVLYSDKQVCCL